MRDWELIVKTSEVEAWDFEGVYPSLDAAIIRGKEWVNDTHGRAFVRDPDGHIVWDSWNANQN